MFDFLPEFDEIKSEYPQWSGNQVFSRGIDKDTAVFWKSDKNGIITAMWFGMYITTENSDIWKKILTVLGNTAPLILVDWNSEICVNLTDSDEIKNYIRRD